MASRRIFSPTEARGRSADINRLDDLEFFPQGIDFETHHLGHRAVAEFVGPPPAVLGDRRPGREAFLVDHQGFASQARAGDVAGDYIHGSFNPSSSLTGLSRALRESPVLAYSQRHNLSYDGRNFSGLCTLPQGK